jgi:WD40 repeat protein
LPLERDLGAVSLWPEVQKLFGHDTELYCLTSTVESCTSITRIAQGDDSNGSATASSCSNGVLASSLSPLVPPMILVASSSKARDAQAASIRIWKVTDKFDDGSILINDVETKSLTRHCASTKPSTPSTSIVCTQILQGGHKSTVATMSFSSSGKYLISSGKDRRICLWVNNNNDGDHHRTNFILGWYQDTAHKRIIWSIHFCPTLESTFASGSRDGTVKIWKVAAAAGARATTTLDTSSKGRQVAVQEKYYFSPAFVRLDTKKPDSVTAIAFAPVEYPQTSALILAVGLETGRIELWAIPNTSSASVASVDNGQIKDDTIMQFPQLLHAFDNTICHIASISKLAWRPYLLKPNTDNTTTEDERNNTKASLQLASCSMDQGCRIFDVVLP